MRDFETGWDKTDRLLMNLINMKILEEDREKRNEYQKIIDKMISPKPSLLISYKEEEE